MSFPDRSRVWVAGIQRARGGWIRDLLRTDDDVHGHALLTTREADRHSAPRRRSSRRRTILRHPIELPGHRLGPSSPPDHGDRVGRTVGDDRVDPECDHRPQVRRVVDRPRRRTATPAARASPTSPASTEGHEGVDALGSRPGLASTRDVDPARPARAARRRGATGRPGGRPRGSRGRTRRRPPAPSPSPGQPRRGGRPARAAARHSPSLLISMFTTIPWQASSASSSSGTPGGQVRSPRSSPTRPAPAISGSWWTTRAPSALRRTSSSTPSAPEPPGLGEGGHRVLGGAARWPPVGEDQHRSPVRNGAVGGPAFTDRSEFGHCRPLQ